MITEITI